MPTLTTARAALAAALSDATDGNVVARWPLHGAKQGDGWVTVVRVEPAETFGAVTSAQLSAAIIAGHDAATAEIYADEMSARLAHAVLDASSMDDYPTSGVSVEPALIPAGIWSDADVFALLVTCTVEYPED